MEQGKGNCLIQRKGLRSVQPMLIDRRPEIILKSSHGDITADHQCQLVFGTDSKNCRPDLKCSKVILEFLVIFGIFYHFQLWCRTYNSQRREMCATRHQPWADGTRCGGNQGGLQYNIIQNSFLIKIGKIFYRFTSMLSQQMYELTIQPFVPRFTCGQRKLGLVDSMVRV